MLMAGAVVTTPFGAAEAAPIAPPTAGVPAVSAIAPAHWRERYRSYGLYRSYPWYPRHCYWHPSYGPCAAYRPYWYPHSYAESRGDWW